MWGCNTELVVLMYGSLHIHSLCVRGLQIAGRSKKDSKQLTKSNNQMCKNNQMCVCAYQDRAGCCREPLQYANPGRCHLHRQVEGCYRSVCACNGLRRMSLSISTKVTSTTSSRPLKDKEKTTLK